MSQFCCREPKIDSELFSLIDDTHTELLVTEEDFGEKFRKQPFNQHLVRKVLRSVKITQEIEEKYRSTKFKRRPFTKKRFFEKFVRI